MRVTSSIAVLLLLFTAACNTDRPLQPNPNIHARPSENLLGHYVVVRVTTRDLGTLPGDLTSTATAVNDSGVVVGTSSSGGGTSAVRWLPSGAVQNLGSLGGSPTTANGINSLGSIVGSATNSSGQSRAFLWTGGVMSIVETDANQTDQYWASGINDAGEIIGWEAIYQEGQVGIAGLLWAPFSHASMFLNSQDILMPKSVNANGVIVGYDQIMDLPFEYTIGGGVTYPPIPQPFSGTASGVNTAGQISASVFLPPPVDTYHAMRLYGGGWTDLGTLTPSDSALESIGNGIDNWGFVVGQSQTLIAGHGSTEAFLWAPDFGMHGLGFLPGRGGRSVGSSQAMATNPNPLPGNGVDSLFVVGQGLSASQYTHAALWTVVVQWVSLL